MGRRSSRPQLVGRQGDRDAPGAGCLPLAPSGHVGAVAQLSPAGRPHGRRAATSAVVRALQEGPSLRRPHPEALQDQAQGRACGASLRFAPRRPLRLSLDRDSAAPIGAMAGSECWSATRAYYWPIVTETLASAHCIQLPLTKHLWREDIDNAVTPSRSRHP